MSDDAALQRALADVCFAEGAGDAIGGDLASFLASRGVAPEDIAAAAARPRNVAVYRSLVRNGLSSVVVRALARTRARMNHAGDGRFDRDFAAFVDRVGPRTHYLRDVPSEFVAWADTGWRTDPALPPYLADLASFELAAFTVGAAIDAPRTMPLAEIALDRALAFDPSVRLLSVGWAVHELSPAQGAHDVPAARDVALLAYRDSEHDVRWLELTPLAAEIVTRLLGGAPLGDAVTGACAAMGSRIDSGAVAALLADLAARGACLGARA